MESNNSKELLLLGLPESGKTTYLTALDEVLNENTAKGGLISDGLSGNRAAMLRNKTEWVSGRSVQRTERLSAEPCVLRVHDPVTGVKVSLSVPDLSGETFNDQWSNRTWTTDYRKQVQRIDGLLLFVTALTAGSLQPIQNGVPLAASTSQPWNPTLSSAQVKLVDLLQFIAKARMTHALPVAVIISAWDVVLGTPFDGVPRNYLERHWSLLAQFLTARSKTFPLAVFGVSAQGGETGDPNLLAIHEPAERVFICDENGRSGDLTLPIRWALSLSDSSIRRK